MKQKKRHYKLKIAIVLCMFIFIYFGIAFYYFDGFSFGTWVNGIYCTGKNVEEVNQELLAVTEFSPIIIRYGENSVDQLSLEQIISELDYTDKLKSIMDIQNPFLWICNVISAGRGSNITPSVVIDETILEHEINQLENYQNYIKKDQSVRIQFTKEQGYYLYNGKEHILDPKRAKEIICTAIVNGISEVDLEQEGCFKDKALLSDEKKLTEYIENLRQFLKFEINYDFGDQEISLNYPVLCTLLKTENGVPDANFEWDTDAVKSFIEQLSEQFDTYNKDREFHTSSGKDIIVPGGNYGNQIDQKKELVYLKDALENHKTEIHIPEYSKQAYVRGVNDLGDTYIEIDLSNQEMYFYQNGKCIINTPVVTGNMLYGRDTPAGTYYVYLKQKNRILRGPNYASHVNFWMPIHKGIGIHDALWRDEFGGDIYETSGSHGCINTPLDAMTEIYDLTEVGMPVVLYYE